MLQQEGDAESGAACEESLGGTVRRNRWGPEEGELPRDARQLTPDDQDRLEDKVHGDPVKNGADRDRLEEVHAAKDGLSCVSTNSLPRQPLPAAFERNSAYPVREPLLVVIGAGRLDGLDGEVGGEGPADEVGDGLGETEHVEEDQDDGPAGVGQRCESKPSSFNYEAEGGTRC